MNFYPSPEVSDQLHPEIRDALKFGYTSSRGRPATYEPTNVFAAIGAAARILRKNQKLEGGEPLVQSAVSINPQTVFEGLFESMLNQSLLPQDVSDFSARRCSEYNTSCMTSEVLFGKAAMALESSYSDVKYPNNYGVRVITRHSQPLFIHKMEGATTALSLQPLTIDGITYPAGSIMGLHVRRDHQDATNRYTPQLEANTVQAVDASEITGADFLRPSLLMAPPQERVQYLSNPDYLMAASIYRQAMNRVTSNSITELASVAATAIEHC